MDNLFCFLCLITAVFFQGTFEVEGTTNILDRKVLDYLYNTTDDKNHAYANWTGWGNRTRDPCTDNWYGITCVEEGSIHYVTGIDLPRHYLLGLPAEIVGMKYLMTLVVSENYITGKSFPMEIFTMQTLEHLDISLMYSLNISLPAEMKLPNLKHLYASKSRLSGYFPQIWDTPKLEDLVLDNNELIGYIPSDLGKSINLKQLMLQGNTMSSYRDFPSNYGDLHQLVNLSLIQVESFQHKTLCATIPTTWEAMVSLENISLCLWDPLPDFVGKSWQRLREFTIVGGQYVGNIPVSLCKLVQLERLEFSISQFTGLIPDCIFSMPKLIYVDLSYNGLSGPIPKAIGAAKSIKHISLANNHLNGTLPQDIGQLTSLTYLSLANNILIGKIPSEFGMLTANSSHSVTVDLSYNMIFSIESGLEYFFRDTSGNFYGNPFQCPLPPYVHDATCSMCNTGANHNSCEECVSAGCGWCSYGPNCVEGSHQGPVNNYMCPEGYWSFETCRD